MSYPYNPYGPPPGPPQAQPGQSGGYYAPPLAYGPPAAYPSSGFVPPGYAPASAMYSYRPAPPMSGGFRRKITNRTTAELAKVRSQKQACACFCFVDISVPQIAHLSPQEIDSFRQAFLAVRCSR
jgi:hypothetical protein